MNALTCVSIPRTEVRTYMLHTNYIAIAWPRSACHDLFDNAVNTLSVVEREKKREKISEPCDIKLVN